MSRPDRNITFDTVHEPQRYERKRHIAEAENE
jgi:hypothetical protein